MIWHIFKKDARLLWPLALAVVMLQGLCAGLTWFLGYFNEPAQLAGLTHNLPLLVYLGIGLLGIAVVHQEPLVASRADWLVRPISRKDLALAKVLFMVLLVNLPIMLVDIAQQVALHFSLFDSLGVAALRSLGLMAAFSLPALVLGTVSQSVMNALVFGIACAIGFIFLVAAAYAALSPGQLPSNVTATGFAGAGLVITLAAAAILAFQYNTRNTLLSRCMAIAAVTAALCTFFSLPQKALAGIESLSASRSGNQQIVLQFEPTVSHVTAALGSQSVESNPYMTQAMKAALEAEAQRGRGQIEQVRLPIRLSGLHENEILLADDVKVRVRGQSGALLYEGSEACYRGSNGLGIGCLPNALAVWPAGPSTFDIRTEQVLNLPLAAYARIKNQNVRLEIRYSLTRLTEEPSQSIAASGGVQALHALGSCATRLDDDGDEVELWCLTNEGVPSCAVVYLVDPQTNARNPELRLCKPNYAPFHRTAFEDAVARARVQIPFRDASGLAHYPVGTAEIRRAMIVFKAYEPVEHLQRTLEIPNIRLDEWRASTPRN